MSTKPISHPRRTPSNMNSVAFLVAAGEYAGSGHATRCLQLAEALLDESISVKIFARDVDLFQQFSPNHEIIFEQMDVENPHFEPVRCFEPSRIVADVLTRHPSYFEALRSIAPACQIEDRGGDVAADSVVSGYCQVEDNYSPVHDAVELYLGESYLILPPFLKSIERRCYPIQIEDVLVSFGSVDISNKTSTFIEILSEISTVDSHVILPRFSQNQYDPPVDHVHTYPFGYAYRELLRKVDIAITGGGNMSYELAAIGIPGAVVAEKAKQQSNAERMEQRGLVRDWGLFQDSSFREFESKTQGFLTDKESHETINENCIEKIDFRGVDRITDIIKNT